MKSITILKSHFTKQGGAEKYARCLADAFHQNGCHVTVLTTGISDQTFPYDVISQRLKSKTSVSKVWEFESFCDQYLKAHPTDIVFGMDRNRFQTHLRAGSGVHKSYLEHRKSYEPSWKRLRHMLNPLHTTLLHMEKTGFEHPDLKVLFTNSNLVKNEVLSHFVINPKKITVIHNGVQWHQWQANFDTWEKTSSRFEFLFIGSDFYRKGLIPLLKGLCHLSNRDFHLSIVGADKHQKHFEHLVQKWNLQNHVTFCGAQNDIRPFLQKADCLVIPSYYDPFANVTVEALAMGLFVISSKTNGGCEVLTHDTGCTIEDLNDMKHALETALQRPKTKQSAALIRESVKHLDFSTQLSSYLDICLSTC